MHKALSKTESSERRTRIVRLPQVVRQDYSVIFFVDSVRPEGLPPFPYIVNGVVAGRVRMVAYISAESPTDAGTSPSVYFPDSYVESVEPGRIVPDAPTFQGVAAPEKRQGLFARLFSIFS